MAKLGFVQADPIRAPARAQDLTLRHRVKNYRAGDLERRYAALGIDEGFFINYGFLPRRDYLLLHPRLTKRGWGATKGADAIHAFIRERKTAHPRDVEEKFAFGTTTNFWGGSSNATTHLLTGMHYRGLLRVVRRDNGIRVYAVEQSTEAVRDALVRRARLDALIDIIVRTYAPLPAASLATTVGRLRYGVPEWTKELKPALLRATQRLPHAPIDGIEWYWPAGERADRRQPVADDHVRLLSPFDPLVWDRRRFEQFWGWEYRFEAYTPAARRKLGYYALPLLWRDRVIGWANASTRSGTLDCQFGFVDRKPRDAAFARALDEEVERLRAFLTPSS